MIEATPYQRLRLRHAIDRVLSRILHFRYGGDRRGDLAIHGRKAEVKTHDGGPRLGGGEGVGRSRGPSVNYGVIITVVELDRSQNQAESETFERVAKPGHAEEDETRR